MTPWLITGVTVVLTYLLDRWDTPWFRRLFAWVPAILLAYLLPAGVSWVTGADYSGHTIHDYSRAYFIPLAIVAVMSGLSVGQLRSIGWKPLAVFVAGSAWIAVFPAVLAFFLAGSDFVTDTLVSAGYWKGLPPIVGSWIGGSSSQLVLKVAVDCPEHIFLSILVLDNILVNIWTILMFQGIKRSDALNDRLGITDRTMPADLSPRMGEPLHPLWSIALLVGSVLVINHLVESFVAGVLILSAAGLLFGNLLPRWNHAVALRVGAVMILVVMAVLGLRLRFDLVRFDGALTGFLVVWLSSHFAFMLLVARALNVNAAWVPIGSMANVGGIATAPAVTAAYEKRWMPHAVLLAILSMATGTVWGLLTIYLFEWWVV
ncbi:putative membrane protein [Lewinella marina]|uniref:DUF819 family protein n=1 Tax=Neolewinella marina TaxID=438751 RepID=A0A2G0CAZ3_9BACT|nr:DUF819 family protein [Neolewinella marina]NJB84281.1 putative membrane protein [Neolewinella marina]PHK97136.1 hypothetical protein CGL56_17425 [Neolewinella marina]